VFRAVMLFGLRWQAQRDTAFLRSALRDFANQRALNAPEAQHRLGKSAMATALCRRSSKMRLLRRKNPQLISLKLCELGNRLKNAPAFGVRQSSAALE